MDRRNLGRLVWVVLAAVLAASSPAVAGDVEGSKAVTASLPRSDFDGDGRTDLLWRNSGGDGMNGLWFMNGATVTTTGLLPTVAGPFEANGWSVAAHGDFNADGRADVLWRSENGDMAVWLVNGTTLTGGAFLPAVASPWTVVGVGNFDAALGDDIFWRNTTTGENAIWFMNGTAISGAALVTTLATAWTPHLGDFNGDGACDLFWRNEGTGENAVWLMAGATLVSGHLLPATASTIFLASGDLDADGRADVLWRQLGSGQLTVWLMNGGAVASEATVDADGPPLVANGLGDVDGDGRADIVWRDLDTDELGVWFMNGTAVSGVGALPWAAPGDTWSLAVPRSTESFDPRPGAPVAATPVSPTGAITNPLPTYTWNAVSGAAWYSLRVEDAYSSPVVQNWYDASAVCPGTTCSAMPPTSLAAGEYSWLVQTVNRAGFGPWSVKLLFTVPTPAGAATTLIEPGSATGGTSTTLYPTYQWSSVANATYYFLYIAPSATPDTPVFSNWYPSGSVCSGTTCSATPSGSQVNLVLGTEYVWWVQTYFAAGYGAVSTPFYFTASTGLPPGATTLTAPGSGSTLAVITPTFEWTQVTEATWYRLYVEKLQGDGVTWLPILDQWITSEQACASGSCEFSPAVQGGDQRWAIQTYNSNGFGPWSATWTFTNNLPLRSFVLTWQAEPRDLDSHMLTPSISGTSYHVYYASRGNKTAVPFVYLDVDDVTGWGPETTSVHVLYPGTYKFYIYLFSGSGSLMGCQATVKSYDADANITHTVVVPNSGSTTARYWYVADVDGASGAVTIRNTLMETAPTAATGASVVTSLPPKTPENGPRR